MSTSDQTAMADASGGSFAIELRDISKSFGPVQANKDVSLEVRPGTIHGIIGENGAGKSTLMSILYGFYEADKGDVLIDGKPLKIRNSHDAIASGIGMVHQHFMLVGNMTVLDNVMLGAEGGWKLARGAEAARYELEQLESDYGLEVSPDAVISELPVGAQQRVEILKALYRGAKILILDEPTGVLTPQETDRLFEILASLREQGVTVILITHKLREIMAITDHVSVMRGGEMVAHRATADTSKEELAELMVGRKVLFRVDKAEARVGAEVLAVDGLNIVDESGISRVKDANFTVNTGEILGIAGVSGNGQSELLEALAGIRKPTSGQIRINGSIVTNQNPLNAAEMREHGIGHVPEDRHHMGVVLPFEAQESAILGHHEAANLNGMFLTDQGAVLSKCQDMMERFDVRPTDPYLKSANFSGGNQQKLVLAREIDAEPKILLAGQPTRGVDIGAIEFIHRQLIAIRDAGSAVILVSVELDEIMSLADRILVMSNGRIVGEVSAEEADERTLGLMMANVSLEEARQEGQAE